MLLFSAKCVKWVPNKCMVQLMLQLILFIKLLGLLVQFDSGYLSFGIVWGCCFIFGGGGRSKRFCQLTEVHFKRKQKIFIHE